MRYGGEDESLVPHPEYIMISCDSRKAKMCLSGLSQQARIFVEQSINTQIEKEREKHEFYNSGLAHLGDLEAHTSSEDPSAVGMATGSTSSAVTTAGGDGKARIRAQLSREVGEIEADTPTHTK
jgi:hypothetical protein